jgi:ribonuclease Y
MDLLSHPYLLVCISLLLGTALGIYLRKLVVEGHEKNIKIQSKKIVENAIVEAEQLKKEALLQSKESAYQIKQALESELKTERGEFKEEQRQLKRKRDSLKREWDSFDRKQSDLYKSEQLVKQQELDWNEKHKEIDTLVSKKRYELAQLAGISQEEAKKLLMDSLESEARMEAAKRLVRIENEMKMEADRKGKNILALAISRYAGDYVADRTVSMVPLPSDEM